MAFDAEFLCPSRPGLPRDPDFFHRANEQNLFLLTPFFDERRYSSGPMYLDPYLANCVKSHIAQIKQHLSSPLPTDGQNFARSAYLALLGLLILLAEPEKGGIASLGYGVAEEMVNYIRQHYADPSLNTEQIAKHFARHRSAIYTAFEFATGFSIKEFLDRYRVFAGKKLLAFTRLPVAEVAIQVGCSNENTFIATFKRVCGTTPGNFRKKLRRQNPAAR